MSVVCPLFFLIINFSCQLFFEDYVEAIVLLVWAIVLVERGCNLSGCSGNVLVDVLLVCLAERVLGS